MRTLMTGLGASVLVLVATPVAAQVFVGDRGASCGTVPQAGGGHTITVTGAVPAGSALVIAAGTTGNATYSATTDTRGNSYTTTASRFNPDQGFRAFTILGRITTPLQAGDSVTITYSAAAVGGESSCASSARFDAITFPNPTDYADGNTPPAPTTIHSVNVGPTTFASELIHTSFAFGAATGGVGINPGTPTQLICTAGNAFCVVPAYRIVAAIGTYTLTATTTNSVRSTVAAVSYRALPLVFANGFE